MDRIQRLKTIVREWLLENSDGLDAHGVQMEMVADNADYLRIILETEDRMGEIVMAWYDKDATGDGEYREALKNGVDTLIHIGE